MSADLNPERSITVTTHISLPTYPRVIRVPAHFSLDETREVIRAAISKHMPAVQGLMDPNSSIVFASGKYLFTHDAIK
jgi:hypothetical protein